MAKWILRIFLGIVFSAFALLVGLFIWAGVNTIFDDSSEVEQAQVGPKLVAGDDSSAYALCETAIKQVSLNADKVDLPWSKPIDNGESWRILWLQSKRAKLQNAYGAVIDTNVICNVRKSDGAVDELIIDGEKIVGN